MYYKNLFLILSLTSLKSFSQNQNSVKETYHIKSISTGIGFFSGEENAGGLDFYIDLTTNYKKHLFSMSASIGSEINLFDASRDYKELAIIYGRELELNKTFKIEVHSGIAIFNETYKNGSTNFNAVSETVLGLPIKAKLLVYISKHFGLGVNPNIIINSIDTLYSGNLIFQYKF